MLNRGFFSLQQPWIPTAIALANLVLNVALYAVFYRVGTWGIPFSISLANIAGVGMLLFVLRRTIGRIDLRAQPEHRAAGGWGVVKTGPVPLLAGRGAGARRRAAAARAQESQHHQHHDG